MVAFQLDERGIPRQGYPIVDEHGLVIGNVTSGTMSPSHGVGIGMGYVFTEHSKLSSKIYIQIRKKAIPAPIVRLPLQS